MIGKSIGCVLNQERSFYNRKGRSKTGKGCSKIGKGCLKAMLPLKIFSAKTNRFVHKLNGKIEVENVAYTLNFTKY